MSWNNQKLTQFPISPDRQNSVRLSMSSEHPSAARLSLSTERQQNSSRLSGRVSSKRISISNLVNESPRAGFSSTPTRAESLSSALTIQCNFSGCKRKFPSEEALAAHRRRVHTAPTKYDCPHCHHTYATPQNRNRHVRSVHEKFKPFTCPVCGKKFGFKDGLMRHIQMVHEQDRPFPCDSCARSFKTKAHLHAHHLALHPEIFSENQPVPPRGPSNGRQ